MQQFTAWSRQLHALNALQDQPTDSLPDVEELLYSQAESRLSERLQKQQSKKLALMTLARSVRQTFKLFMTALYQGQHGKSEDGDHCEASWWHRRAQEQVEECLRACAFQAAQQEAALCNHLAAYVASEQESFNRSHRVPAAKRPAAPCPISETHEHEPLACVAEEDAALNSAVAAADGHDGGQVAPAGPFESSVAVVSPSPCSALGDKAARAAGGDKADEAEQRAVDAMTFSDKVS